MHTVETRHHCYPGETKYKASWSLWVFFLYWFSPSIFSVCVLHTTKQVSANRLTPFAKSILGLEHIHLFESPRIPLSDQKDFYSIILEATRNTFDSFHLHSYWYFWPHYVDSMARNIMNRSLRIDDFGSTMPLDLATCLLRMLVRKLTRRRRAKLDEDIETVEV